MNGGCGHYGSQKCLTSPSIRQSLSIYILYMYGTWEAFLTFFLQGFQLDFCHPPRSLVFGQLSHNSIHAQSRPFLGLGPLRPRGPSGHWAWLEAVHTEANPFHAKDCLHQRQKEFACACGVGIKQESSSSTCIRMQLSSTACLHLLAVHHMFACQLEAAHKGPLVTGPEVTKNLLVQIPCTSQTEQ